MYQYQHLEAGEGGSGGEHCFHYPFKAVNSEYFGPMQTGGRWEYVWIGEFGEMDHYKWSDINMSGRSNHPPPPSLLLACLFLTLLPLTLLLLTLLLLTLLLLTLLLLTLLLLTLLLPLQECTRPWSHSPPRNSTSRWRSQGQFDFIKKIIPPPQKKRKKKKSLQRMLH